MSDANIEKLFPGRTKARPKVYAYAETRPEFEGLLKVNGGGGAEVRWCDRD